MTSTRPRLATRAISAIAAGVAALALAACSGGSTGQSASQSADAAAADNAAGSAGQTAATDTFPVTITSALGDAVIKSEPKRVVAWGWASGDAALALGVVPVGLPTMVYGQDENGLMPWTNEKLKEMGVETPTLLPGDAEAPLEQIAALTPDVIIAPYSGLTQAEYDKLSAIAPVVAYPDKAWSTPWRDIISITAKALGRTAQGEKVIADIDKAFADKAAEHPEFAGKTVAQMWLVGDSQYVYLPNDPRVEMVEALGLKTDPSVTAMETGESTFYYTISPEKMDQLKSDVLVIYGDTDADIDTFLASSSGKLLEQAKSGHIARIVGPSLIQSVAPPTALSATWGLDKTVEALAGAVK